jgi:hypothetical protein
VAKYKLTNRGGTIAVKHQGTEVTLQDGEVLHSHDPELARKLSRFKYVELEGELPKEEEAPPQAPISEDLQLLSKQELVDIAISLDIPVKSKMNKAQLREAIESAKE